jgi:RNA polymerase sigma-70 factor
VIVIAQRTEAAPLVEVMIELLSFGSSLGGVRSPVFARRPAVFFAWYRAGRMSEANRSVAAVLLARHPDLDAAAQRAIADDFERAVAAARAGTGIDAPAERFAAHVARWLRPDEDPRGALAQLRIDQLWVACAAGHGDAAAIALVEQRYLTRAADALRGMHDVADEALQRVRELLFVGKQGRPRILDYAGRGELAGWIRTTAMREAFALLSPRREQPAGDRELLLPSADPALELMKQQYGASFKGALAGALAALPAETRDVLRRYYIDGLGLEQIAALDGVAASTISRRLDKARRALETATREALAAALRIGDDEVDSILRLLDSRLELSRSALANGAP